MNRHRNNLGFSLTEMLIATGIMAIGLVMVATIFPVGVKLTSMSTERTIGAVVADEAFAKIQLYGLRDFDLWPVTTDPTVECVDFQYIVKQQDFNEDGTIDAGDARESDWNEFRYPSTLVPPGENRNYHWSALCRRVGDKDVQVTVFVTRKVAAASQYRAWEYDPTPPTPSYSAGSDSNWPKPIPVNVHTTADSQTLKILLSDPADTINEEWDTLTGQTGMVLSFLDDGYTIVDNYSGNIYRVLEVDRLTNTLILQQDWVPSPNSPDETIWVVPPAVGSDRYPCVGVYQKTIYFETIN